MWLVEKLANLSSHSKYTLRLMGFLWNALRFSYWTSGSVLLPQLWLQKCIVARIAIARLSTLDRAQRNRQFVRTTRVCPDGRMFFFWEPVQHLGQTVAEIYSATPLVCASFLYSRSNAVSQSIRRLKQTLCKVPKYIQRTHSVCIVRMQWTRFELFIVTWWAFELGLFSEFEQRKKANT